MATTSIQVNKQSVIDLLRSSREHPFIIPEYQRPYAWSDDEIDTLYNDIWDFTVDPKRNDKSTYFLGTIVSYENENGEWEIIDGQQRITSLFLLLRAIYAHLQETPVKGDEENHFIGEIEKTIWITDRYTGKVDYSKILLKSKVISDEGNEILKNILVTGNVVPGAKDNYSRNYLRFRELFRNSNTHSGMKIYSFIDVLLNLSILLPITADNQDTALTIFSTLNNRGLPLSDADIFKAKIYNHTPDEKKSEFIDTWRFLEEQSAQVGLSIQNLFYYYMFYLRAKDGIVDSTTPGVRKYYEEKQSFRLLEANLLDDLKTILNVFRVLTLHDEVDNEPWSNDVNIRRILDILSTYNNEYWKYPTVIYYLTHRKEPEFAENFKYFLRKLAMVLVSKFLEIPSINGVKVDIIKLNRDIINSPTPEFNSVCQNVDSLKERIIFTHRSLVRMILKILAYEEQEGLLPQRWEIEHIFPQKWDTTRYPDKTKEETNALIEHLGNKVALEKPLNIGASNGYYSKKAEKYAQSGITAARKLASHTDWTLDDITVRDEECFGTLKQILERWDSEYAKQKSSSTENVHPDLSTLSKEELIELLLQRDTKK
ncbi:MAG: DUF262 domain-containing HNH endonuclease family protein [Bacteroides sp.]|nr:DUF262 domain-containing HNH endonuclease family protein [Bacteroides sp.]MCM1378678.1 DUF262 domain-containing HNH endonuclease family protein [Bacteroides sp.]MCM1444951.1 DUF262 domain-containing HNH endonuclease family protein [Prevotella sp.]